MLLIGDTENNGIGDDLILSVILRETGRGLYNCLDAPDYHQCYGLHRPMISYEVQAAECWGN